MSLCPSPAAQLWKKGSPYLQLELLMFQLLPLPLTLSPCTAVKTPALSSPSLPSVPRMLLSAPQTIPSPGQMSPGPAASLHRTRAPATLSPASLWVFFLYCAAKPRHRPSVETMTLSSFCLTPPTCFKQNVSHTELCYAVLFLCYLCFVYIRLLAFPQIFSISKHQRLNVEQ